jgi:hypothetical protein
MSDAAIDPYAVLGISPDASDGELRRAYRDLVKRHHPDHNGGSAESTARFAQIQSAYAVIAQWRRSPQSDPAAAAQPVGAAEPAGARFEAADPNIESRIANLEQELAQMRAAEQRQARERARQAAARQPAAGAAPTGPRRPTPEELGYFTTDDSFTRIVDDATEQITERLRGSDAKRQFTRRLSDLFGRRD